MFSVSSKEIKGWKVKKKQKQIQKIYIYSQQNMESAKTEYMQQEQKCISDLNLKLHLIWSFNQSKRLFFNPSNKHFQRDYCVPGTVVSV